MPRGDHPNARRALAALVTVAIAAGGIVGLLLFFNARDDAPVTTEGQGGGPGEVFADQGADHLAQGDLTPPYNSSPPTSGSHRPRRITRDGSAISDDQLLHAIELGNVVLLYDAPAPPAPLVALADELAGPFDRALVDGGQQVILARRPGTEGVVAVAWRRLQRAATPGDAALREFTEAWLGQGAGA